MNAADSHTGKTIWAFDLGKGSIGEAVRCGNQFLQKASLRIPGDFVQNKKGAAKAPVQELRLMVSLLSSRQFEIPTTAGFDLVEKTIRLKFYVNCGLHN